MMRWAAIVLAGTMAFAAADPPARHLPSIIDRRFYQPAGDKGQRPSDRGWRFEDMRLTSADGTKLHGWFVPAPSGSRQARGTVLYAKGINGSIGDIIGSVQWIRDAGWNVVLFDYRGYGRSEGQPSRLGVIEDTQAVLKHVKARKDIDQEKVVAMGYSLGGSTLLTAIGREQTAGIQLVIPVSAFSSYRRVIADTLGSKVSLLDNNAWAPEEFIGKVAPTPIVLIHGKKDRFIPVRHARILHEAAKPGAATFIGVETGTHTAPFGDDPGAMIRTVLRLMDAAVR